MAILKLKPSCKDYLWGGHRLVDEFHKEYDGPVLAETWELSCYPDSPCWIVNGPDAGKTLRSYLDEKGWDRLGTNCARFRDFPILTKFIDAKQSLSIQVHPDDAYAMEHEHQFGKTEMWYVVDADPGAFLYYGFEKKISREEFERRIHDHTLEEVLHASPVKKGDVFFIQAGTLHAIGKGILIAEIQQNSNVTYRVYDYGRLGKDGKPRQLHVRQALDVTKREPVSGLPDMGGHLGQCSFFTVDRFTLTGGTGTFHVDGTSFLHLLFLDGEGTIRDGAETLPVRKGDSVFVTAGSGEVTVEGHLEALTTVET